MSEHRGFTVVENENAGVSLIIVNPTTGALRIWQFPDADSLGVHVASMVDDMLQSSPTGRSR